MNNILKQNKKPAIINWLLLSLFLAHLIFGHIAFKGFVLCIGFDGHVAIEYATAQATCDDGNSTTARAEFVFSPRFSNISPQSHCGECVDMPLISQCHEYSKIPVKNALSHFGQFAKLIPSAEEITANVFHPTGLNHDPGIVNLSFLKSLHTVVLLI